MYFKETKKKKKEKLRREHTENEEVTNREQAQTIHCDIVVELLCNTVFISFVLLFLSRSVYNTRFESCTETSIAWPKRMESVHRFIHGTWVYNACTNRVRIEWMLAGLRARAFILFSSLLILWFVFLKNFEPKKSSLFLYFLPLYILNRKISNKQIFSCE